MFFFTYWWSQQQQHLFWTLSLTAVTARTAVTGTNVALPRPNSRSDRIYAALWHDRHDRLVSSLN